MDTNAGSANSQQEPYEFSMRLPAVGLPLGKPERLADAVANGFLRARSALGVYALTTRKNNDAILELQRDNRVSTAFGPRARCAPSNAAVRSPPSPP